MLDEMLDWFAPALNIHLQHKKDGSCREKRRDFPHKKTKKKHFKWEI